MQFREDRQQQESDFIEKGNTFQKTHKKYPSKITSKQPYNNTTILLISIFILAILAYFYFGGVFNFANEEAGYKEIELLKNNQITNTPLRTTQQTSLNNAENNQNDNFKLNVNSNPQSKNLLDLEQNPVPKLLAPTVLHPQVKIQQQPQPQNNDLNLKPGAQLPKSEILEVDQYPKGLKISMQFQRFSIDMSKQIPDDKKVTAVFTSCNRYDLLDKTLTTFYKYNSYPLEQLIVVQDGHISPGLQLIMQKFPQITWLITGKKLGQLAAIDQAYKLIRTPYVFHSQDDWEFLHSGFIEESFVYFQKIPNMVQLWIRKHNHPVDPITRIATSDYTFSLNPGLKKMSDYEKVGKSYSKFTNNVSFGKGAGSGEIILTKFYKTSGYVVAQSQIQYTRHLGQGRGLGKVFKRITPAKASVHT